VSKRFVTQIESDVPDGTAPIIVDSSTLVANLNADLLDGQHGNYYAPIASPTFTGSVITAAATTAGPSIRLPHGTAPTSPTNGDLWTTTSGIFARINGSTVGPFIDSSSVGSATIAVSDTAPSTANGKLWYNSSNGRTYLYYEDGSSNQWVEVGTAAISPTANYDGGNPTTNYGGVSALDGGGVT